LPDVIAGRKHRARPAGMPARWRWPARGGPLRMCSRRRSPRRPGRPV